MVSNLGQKIAVPSGSAWTTLDELVKRADDKKKRASEKKRQASESLATPKKARSDPTPSDRDARLQEIALQLANDKNFQVLFSAVSSLEKLQVTVAEAHKQGLGKSLKKLVDDDQMSVAERQMQAGMDGCHQDKKPVSVEPRAEAAMDLIRKMQLL